MSTEFSVNQMVRQQIRTWNVLNQRILTAMREIPRARFVPFNYINVAYADFCIPLDHGQVMLAPNVAGRILQSVNPQPTDSVLEVGTGSGYLTACLASLAGRVTSLDTHTDFIDKSAQIAEDLGLNNIQFVACEDYEPQGDRRYDVVVINGSLPAYDQRYERMLQPGGRLFVITGDSPAMDARLVTRMNGDEFLTESVFETDLPRLTTPVGSEHFEF